MEKSKYMEQFERVNRWFERLKSVAEGVETPKFPELHRDDMFAFFMNCYHLKDWIKNDPSVVHLKPLVEPYINSSEALSICADICNGLKHLVLDESRSGQNPQFHTHVYDRIELDLESERVGLGLVVVTKKGDHDALDLAFQCLMEWEAFLVLNHEPISLLFSD